MYKRKKEKREHAADSKHTEGGEGSLPAVSAY